MPENSVIKKEMETYNKNKEKLLAENAGKYVLIKSDNIIGVYESQQDAITVGIAKFGNVPFLVKKIEAVEQTQNFASNLILLKKS